MMMMMMMMMMQSYIFRLGATVFNPLIIFCHFLVLLICYENYRKLWKIWYFRHLWKIKKIYLRYAFLWKRYFSCSAAFDKFLIIWNKNIGFLLTFFQEFSKEYHIFELWSLFATFESLKFVDLPMHAVVRNLNSKYFHSNSLLFQITL